MSKHEGITFPCGKCSYAAATASDLGRHFKSKHEFPCEKCEYTATTASDLKRHVDSILKGARYPCEKCEYTS